MSIGIKPLGARVVIKKMEAEEKTAYAFYLLEEKAVGVVAHEGKITRRSVDGRYALLCTDTELSEKQNIMLRKDDDCIYAKIIRQDADGYVICITAVTKANQ